MPEFNAAAHRPTPVVDHPFTRHSRRPAECIHCGKCAHKHAQIRHISDTLMCGGWETEDHSVCPSVRA